MMDNETLTVERTQGGGRRDSQGGGHSSSGPHPREGGAVRPSLRVCCL